MEWIIGVVVLFLIWRLFFANTSQSVLIDRDIHRAYLAEKTGKIGVKSELDYTRCREYAMEKGAEERRENGKTSIDIEKMIDGVKHNVSFYLRPDKKANVLVTNIETVERTIKKILDI